MAKFNYHNILGWDIPIGTFPCWVISDYERIKSLKKNEPFYDYSPSCYFKPIQRINNNFLIGNLGHDSYNGEFHCDILRSYSYFEDYLKRQPVYFSFDRITLYRLIEIQPAQPLNFILKRIDSPKVIINGSAFMIMPFGHDDLNNLYKNDIMSFLQNDRDLQIQIFRADDFNGNDIIIDTIYNQIEQSEFVIAEISNPNKNVFYELGWASAMGKEIITIQNKDIEENIFFDRSHIRTRLYSLNNVQELQRQLKNDIIAIRKKTDSSN